MSSFTKKYEGHFNDTNDRFTFSSGFFYYLGDNLTGWHIEIIAGYVSDGLTLPKGFGWLRPFFPRWDYLKAVAVHDKLCKYPYFTNTAGGLNRVPQIMIDNQFRKGLRLLGMSDFKSQVIYLGVRFYQAYIRDKKAGFYD